MWKWIEKNKYWCTGMAALLPAAAVIGWITSEADGYRNLVKAATETALAKSKDLVEEAVDIAEEVVA